MGSSTPRHKRLNRPARLQAAKHWILSYPGKNIVKGYRRHFGVDLECAIQELQMLGVALDADYVAAVRRTLANVRSRKKERSHDEPLSPLVESDENFSYIVGHTEGGAPYGITWEETKRLQPASNMDDFLEIEEDAELSEIPF